MYLVLVVEDNGLGLNTGQEEKIFGLFKRLHAYAEGTGTGLYLVKKMLDNAGGNIQVESQVGVGATFTVYFKSWARKGEGQGLFHPTYLPVSRTRDGSLYYSLGHLRSHYTGPLFFFPAMYLRFSRRINYNCQWLTYEELPSEARSPVLQRLQLIVNQFSSIRCTTHRDHLTKVTLYVVSGLHGPVVTAKFKVCCQVLHVVLEYVFDHQHLPYLVEHQQKTLVWQNN